MSSAHFRLPFLSEESVHDTLCIIMLDAGEMKHLPAIAIMLAALAANPTTLNSTFPGYALIVS